MSRKTRPQDQSLRQLLRDLLSSQSGFSLAEIMVAAGMLGVLSLGVSQLMQNSAKTEKRLSQQVNLIALEGKVMESLWDSTACERTLGITENPAGTTTAIPAAPDPSAWTTIPAASNGITAIFQGNPGDQTDPDTWHTAIQTWDGTNGKYGSGSNTVYVKTIEYRGYFDETQSGEGFENAARYNSTKRSAIPGSTTDFSGEIVLKVDFRRGNPASYEALADDDARDAKQKISSYGQQSTPRYYRVKVRTNTAGELVSCYVSSEIIADTYCGSLLDGYLDPNTGKCTNIKITQSAITTATDANAPSNNWSLAAATEDLTSPIEYGNFIAEGSLQVGGDLDSDIPAGVGELEVKSNIRGRAALHIIADTATPSATTDGDGEFGHDLLVHNNATIEKDALVDNNLEVTNKATIQQFLYSPITSLLKGKIKITNTPGTTIPSSETGYLFKVDASNGSNQVLFTSSASGTNSSDVKINTDVDSSGKVYINEDATTPFQILEGSNLVFKVTEDGNVQFFKSSSNQMTAEVSEEGTIKVFRNGNQSDGVIIGDGYHSSSYRPIRIYGDSSVNSFTSIAPNSAQESEVPTKKWVTKMIYGDIYDESAIAKILTDLKDYAQHNPLETIRADMCNSTRLRSRTLSDSYYANCTYNTSQKRCNCNPANCSDELGSGQKFCSNIYLSGVLDADGQIRSNNSIYSDYWIRAGTYLRANTYVQAGTNVTAGNNVVAGNELQGARARITDWAYARRFYTQGISAPGNYWMAARYLRASYYVETPKICRNHSGNLWCNTRFGQFICKNGGVVVGLANGLPVCIKSGGGVVGYTSTQN